MSDDGAQRTYDFSKPNDVREARRNLLAVAPICNAIGCAEQYQKILSKFYELDGILDDSMNGLEKDINS